MKPTTDDLANVVHAFGRNTGPAAATPVPTVPEEDMPTLQARPGVATDDMTLQLRDGPTVSVKAIMAALALESRGCALRVHADGDLLISPQDAVPPAWVNTLRAMKADLVAIAKYCAPPQREKA